MKSSDAVKAAQLIKQRDAILSTVSQIKEGPIAILLSDGKTQLRLHNDFRNDLTARLIASYEGATDGIDKQLAEMGVEL